MTTEQPPELPESESAEPVEAAEEGAAKQELSEDVATPAESAEPTELAEVEASAPEEGEASVAEASEPAAGKKKKRRRRKKKAAEGESKHVLPFERFFEKGARKHAFAVGEVIAGRVERVEDGAVLVDLFGKASAVAELNEPRELPPIEETQENKDAAVAAEDPAQVETLHGMSAPEMEQTPAEDVATTEVVVTPAPSAEPSEPAAPETDETLPGTLEAIAEATQSEEAENEASEQKQEEAKPAEDLSDADLSLLEPLAAIEEELQPGGIFRGRIGAISESGHIAILNRAIDRPAVKKAIRAARAQSSRVQGLVYGYNRGGFDVLVGGVRTFCPASGMALERIEDPASFVGRVFEFSLPQNKTGKRSIVVSRRRILEKQARKQARERMGELKEGDKLQGKVTEVRDYGVLVDLGGGLDGLVHMSEVSWQRTARPADVAKPGDEVEVQVVKLEPASRKDRFGRVSLSMRLCQPDPWDAASEILQIGQARKGQVVSTTEFGAFVKLAEGVEGLLHLSELGGREITHAKQAVEEGAELDVVIERIDKKQRRISLSKLSAADAKALEAGEIDFSKAPKSLKPGSAVNVVVKRVEHNGIQVQVEGVLGKRGRGYLSNRDLGEQSGEGRKGPSQGDVIEVKIVGTDRDGTLKCSVRARQLDEERKAIRDYRKEAASKGLGTFGDLLRSKLDQ